MAQAQGKMSQRQIDLMNDRYIGAEPTFKGNVIKTTSELITAYNWYSYRKTGEESKSWLLEYTAKNFPFKSAAIKQLNEKMMNQTMGWIARMISNGILVPVNVHKKLDQYISDQNVKLREIKSSNDNVVSISNKLSDYIADFEDALDRIDPEFQPYKYLTEKSVAQSHAAKIREYYIPVAEEISLAIKKTDPQVNEAYRGKKKAELVTLMAYLMLFIEDCSKYLGNAKKVRQPRKAKAKKPQQILKHFVYKKVDEDLKLVSVNPDTIIGASQLFVLNVSNNILTVYNAKDGGLSVSRTSITNYDEKTTKSKRVGKKLKEVLAHIFEGNKKSRNNVLEVVSSAFVECSDRINSSCILLKVSK